MFSNEYISITHLKKRYRVRWRRFVGFNQCKKVANEVLSEISVKCFERYGCMPYETFQVIEDGTLEKWRFFVTFPNGSEYYELRFTIINDLPF